MTDRKKKSRDKLAQAGFRYRQFKVHDDDHVKVKEFTEQLESERQNNEQ